MLELVERFEMFINYLPRIHKKVFSDCPALEKLHMTSGQYSALHVISRREEWRMTDLSQKLYVSAGSLTTMINRLIELGLVSRDRSLSDRRVVTVKLTEAGRGILQSGRDHMRHTLSDMLTELPAADRDTFKQSLDSINEIMEKLTRTP